MRITSGVLSSALGQQGFHVPGEGPREMASRSLGPWGTHWAGRWFGVLERHGDIPGLLLSPAWKQVPQ